MSKKPDKDRYDRHKKKVASAQQEMVHAGQEIGPLPPIRNPERRKRAADSLRYFLEAYFPGVFYLKWSHDQLEEIKDLEDVIRNGGTLARAAPRGDGKSARMRGAAEWGILNGYRKYIPIICANDDKAGEELAKIQTACETNYELIYDYPEVLYPVLKLERIAQRQKGQTYLGQHTRMTWLATKLVFPTIPGSKASGSLLTAAGLETGSIRGQSHQTAEGEILRPDAFLLDDPQTTESAFSDLQCERRERLVCSDVMGMAGPKQKMAGMISCTVIRKNDFADRILNPDIHPMFNGRRTKMLISLPTNMDLWDQYADLRRNVRDKGKTATAFYVANREKMDEGALSSWEERFNEDEVSAIQHGMNIKIDRPSAFASECQNSPIEDTIGEKSPVANIIDTRINRIPRREIPKWATKLVTFIDVQKSVLLYKVMAVDDNFTSAIVDDGVWPEQGQEYFSIYNVSKTLEWKLAQDGQAGNLMAAVWYGLECLTERLLSRAWIKEDETELRITCCLIDSGWGESTKTIYEFCRRSKHAAIVMASKGRGLKASDAPMTEWKPQEGRKVGFHYILTSDAKKRKTNLMTFDSNFWKTFLCRRLETVGVTGSLSIFGDNPDQHRLVKAHYDAEYAIKVTARGRSVWEWHEKPNQENHLFDCGVGCFAAAAYLGCMLPQDREQPPPPRPSFEVRF